MTTSLTRTKKGLWVGLCVAMILGCAGIQTVFAQERHDETVAMQRVRAAVAAGDMTPEQGRAKLRAYRARLGQNRPASAAPADEQKIAGYVTRIRAAIADGEMTAEEGRAKMAALRERLSRSRAASAGAAPRTRIAAVEARIRAAVAAGDMTPEQGRAKLQGVKKQLAQVAPSATARVAGGRAPAANEAVGRRLRAAVAAGELTREQAVVMMAALERTTQQAKRRGVTRERQTKARDPGAVYAAAEKKVRAAIKAGKITGAQGRKKLAALKKRLAGTGRETQGRSKQGALPKRTRGR